MNKDEKNPEDLAKKNRLRNLRGKAKELGGITKLSEMLGREKSQISQLIGINPTQKIGAKLARIFEEKLKLKKYSLDQDSLDEENSPSELMPIAHPFKLPILSVESLDALQEQNYKEFNMIDIKEFEREGICVDKSQALRIEDDSMLSTLKPGSWVMVDTTKTEIESGELYAVKGIDKVEARRIYREPDIGYRVACDNPLSKIKIPDRIIQDIESIVIGRLVWQSGKI